MQGVDAVDGMVIGLGASEYDAQCLHRAGIGCRLIGAGEGATRDPAVQCGRTRGWLPETIDRWNAARPGRGVGGGRPRKRSNDD